MIEVLRLGHRIARDKRISTHVALVARAFGANKIYYSGQKDSGMEKSVSKVSNDFGEDFEIEHINGVKSLILDKKKKGFKVVHLTVYGEHIVDVVSKLKDKDILFIIGGEKVPGEIYELADYNSCVGSQPHSEVAALGISLYEYFGKSILKKKFKNAKLEIIPEKKGKNIVKLK
jgi:tRNA (cytidine56-2'-O)-methyltransferase